MADAVTLAFGLILGLLFAGLMVFKILPQLDHVVKKDYGPAEACLFTRFCCLCIALPLYVFTIWMTVVILANEDKGIAVLQDVCGDSYECANAFAMGRIRHDKDACESLTCSTEELHARSGSQPLGFRRLGLGKDLSPSRETIAYTCSERSQSGVCLEMVSSQNSDVCSCTVEASSNDHTFCESYDGCWGDIDGQVRKETCLENVLETCTKWVAESDSDKQFSFMECTCNSDDCGDFTCDVLVMGYYYPNVFYAGLATILFVLPAMIGTYLIVKTQMKKLCKCGDIPLFVYSQDAGVQHHYAGDDLARGPGGFYNEQEQKSKYRTLSKYDALGFFVGAFVIGFFSTLIVMVSGRVGLSFITLAASLIILWELYKLSKLFKGQSENLQERVSKNNPMMDRGEF